MTQALVYTRISRDAKEGSGLGIARQRADCEALAERLGYEVTGLHSDNDTSAYSGAPRPGYDALLAALEAGQASAVLVWHTDRLHRSPAELETYIDVCEPRGIVTQTVKAGALDLATPSGRMVARQLGVIARYEVEHMAERQRRAKAQAADAGTWGGGRRPFGYEKDGVTVLYDEATEVIGATQAVLAGASIRSVMADWERRGVTTSTGGHWHHANVSRVLTRARNAGLREHRGVIVGPAAWPALVDEGQWRAVVSILSDPDRRTGGDGTRKYLGSGLYLCGVCADGTTVVASASGGRRGRRPSYAAYRCETRRHLARRASLIDAYVRQVMIAYVSRPDVLAAVTTGGGPDLSGLRDEATVLRQRQRELAELHADGHVSGTQLRIGTDRARRRLDEIEGRLAREASAGALASIVGVSDVAAAWDGLLLEQRRDIIAATVTVTLLSSPRGRKPGGGYFDPATVVIG